MNGHTSEAVYRNLTEKEILLLESRGCQAESWDSVLVVQNFNPHRLSHVTFRGTNYLGSFSQKVKVSHNGVIDSGIHHAILDSVIVEDDVYIYKIGTSIRRYRIEHHAVIDHVGELITEQGGTFGNAAVVKVLNENGGRSIRIYDQMNSHGAFLQAAFRHRPQLVAKLQEVAERRAQESALYPGRIGAYASLRHCKIIRNVNIGPYSEIDGTSALINGTILSNRDMPTRLGIDVYAKNFIIQEGSSVNYGSSLENSFIGQTVKLEKQFSSIDSVAFAGSEFGHGEIASVFAGPFSVSHHKGTLLIACSLSFFNAGSGTNQSNHLYKLGPNGQGILERGCKTASNVYLRWPKRIGAGTVILGEHILAYDLHQFPFSYLVEIGQKSVLYPGRNISTIGMVRDMEKWKRRDVRKGEIIRDRLNFHLANPMTMQALVEGYERLSHLLEQGEQESYDFETFHIRRKDAKQGLVLYDLLLYSYLGAVLSQTLKPLLGEERSLTLEQLRQALSRPQSAGHGHWLDVGGLIVPQKRIDELIFRIESGELASHEEIDGALEQIAQAYPDDEAGWCLRCLEDRLGKSLGDMTEDDIIQFFQRWIESEQKLFELRMEDARKEFSPSAMNGYGAVPGEDVKQQDFLAVQKTLEEHPAILLLKNVRDSNKADAAELIACIRNSTDSFDQELPLAGKEYR